MADAAIVAQVVIAILAGGLAIAQSGLGSPGGLVFFVVATTTAVLVSVRGVGREIYSFGTVLGAAAALALVPGAIPALLVIPASVDAIRRRSWRVAVQSWSLFTIVLLAANVAARPIIEHGAPASGFGLLGAVCLSAAVFVTINLGLITLGVVLRGEGGWRALPASTWRMEFVMALAGGTMALLYRVGPATAVLALVPFVLLSRILHLPALEREARTDPKTGLLNMRGLSTLLEAKFIGAGLAREPFAIIAGDIDDFRDVNTTYGHVVADEILHKAARTIQSTLRGRDAAARSGGEEFLLLISGATSDRATGIAERIRLDVLRTSTTSNTPITMSFGVAHFPDHGQDIDTLLKSADLALYAAKAAGRNRTCVSGVAGDGPTAGCRPAEFGGGP